jgi:RNA polymerase sigma-70 factor (ECF subfamily)
MKNTKEEIIALVKQVKNGSQKATNRLYLLIKPLIFNAIYCQVNRGYITFQDAEDLAQEISLSVFNSLHTLQVNAFFKGWFNEIVRNKIRDFLRHLKTKKRDPINKALVNSLDIEDFESEDILDNVLMPQELLEDKIAYELDQDLLVENLCKACSQVNRSFLFLLKEVIVLNKKYTEVAKEHGLKLGTVKSRVIRGRGQLTNYFLERGYKI